MILLGGRAVSIETPRLVLRLPRNGDYHKWAALRAQSRAFLTPWEPVWDRHHLTRASFTNRVFWASRSFTQKTALSLLLFRRDDDVLVGGLTVSHIRQAAAQTGTLGYWTGEPHLRQGYMREALNATIAYCFATLGLSRMEAACLPENTASRALLIGLGFVEEGQAEGYLRINGKWRTHVLYGKLRADRMEGGNASG